jgi:hypothetical protein
VQRSRHVLETHISLSVQSAELMHSTQTSVDVLHTVPGGQSSELEQIASGTHSFSVHCSLESQSVAVRQSTHSPVGTLHFERPSGRNSQSLSSLQLVSPLPLDVPAPPPRPVPPLDSPASPP